MANEFVAKNGLISQNNTTITGSLTTSGSGFTSIGNATVTGSFLVTGSQITVGNITITGSLLSSGSGTFRIGATVSGSLLVTGSQTTIGNTIITGSLLTSGSAITFTPSVVATGPSQSYFLITGSISQPTTLALGSQIYGTNIAPTMVYTSGSQTNTVLRVYPTFSGLATFSGSQSNVIADFGAVGVGTQFRVTDTTSGSIYNVNDVSGITILEATSDWTVNMYNGINTRIFQKTGSAININGLQTIAPPSNPGSGVGLVISGSNTKGGNGYLDFLQVTNTSASLANPNKYFRLNTAGDIELLRSDYNATILTLTNGGILSVGGGNLASVTNNDPTTNYLSFGSSNTVIYDDGNTHIHSRSSGQSMWVNTNGGQLNLITQAPVSGSASGSGVSIGGGGTLTGYVTINHGKSYTTAANYGYLTTAGAGTYPGGSQTVILSLYATSRIWGQEIDAFSDERMKNIHGEITLEDGLKLVKTLKPIKYTWKDNNDKGLKAGYSAQQVSKAGFDHLISLIPKEGLEETIDDDGFVSPKDTQFSMNYDQVTPYHGVVIKHLLEKIEQLEQEIQLLKNK